MDMTMEDVETAIKILNEFMRRTREATIVMRRMDITFRGQMEKMPSSMQDFMNMAFKTAQDKKKAQEATEQEAPVEPPTEEDLKRMREIRDKVKSRAL